MHKIRLIGPALLLAAALGGCGGGGGGAGSGNKNTNLTTTRTLVGYVYVKSGAAANDPAGVIITPASTPPPGYDDPTAGTISLIASGGQFMVKSTGSNNGSFFTKDLSLGNDILVTVATQANSQVTVAGGNVVSVGNTLTLAQYTENLNDGFPSGTTHNLSSPNNPDLRKPNKTTLSSLAFTLDGLDPQKGSPTTLLAGQKTVLAIAYLDAVGISIPGIPAYGGGVNLQSDSPRITVDPTDNMIIPAFQGQYPGPATVTASIANPAPGASGSLAFTFSYGPATAITMSMKTASGYKRIDTPNTPTVVLRWEVISNVRPSNLPNTEILTANVTNKYGAAIPGTQVDWTDPKVDDTNTWKTSAGGNAFVDPTSQNSTPNSTTDLTGTATVMFSVPNAVDGPLGGLPADLNDQNGSGDQQVKAQQRILATVDGTTVLTESDIFYITRQIMALQIAEQQVSKYADVNAYSTVPFTCYATDVDKWQSIDTFAANWRCFNVPGGVKLGDPGERDLASHISPTPQASMNGNNLVTGTIAGDVNIQAYTTNALTGADDVVSPVYPVQIWGPPAQIVCLYGPVPAAPNSPWETAEFPLTITTPIFTEPASQFVASEFVPNSLTAPTADVCYFYLGWIDVNGNGDYTDISEGPGLGYELYGDASAIVGATNLTVTYQSPGPGGQSWGFATVPSSPVGEMGAQCVYLTWGPINGNNGSVTLEYKGSWTGSISASPPPAAPVPYDIVRIIKINGNENLRPKH